MSEDGDDNDNYPDGEEKSEIFSSNYIFNLAQEKVRRRDRRGNWMP